MRLFATIVIALLVSNGSSLAQTFNGYDCTEDCSGHEAGYDWAARKGVSDVSGCGGNSNSFIEGCRAFVEENESADVDSEDDGDLRPVSHPLLRGVRGFISGLKLPVFAMPFSWRIRWA